VLEETIKISGIENALKQIETPVIDSLTTQSFRHFWNDIKDQLMLSWSVYESFSPIKTGVKVQFTPTKNLMKLDNCMPMTLLCNDERIIDLV